MFAAKGDPEAAALALPFIEDPNREFVTSDFVRLEVLPKARWNHSDSELEYYETFFQMNPRIIPPSVRLLELAMDEASKSGLNALDALHVASAVFGDAEEMITTEKLTSSLHRTKLIKIISILPHGGGPSNKPLKEKRKNGPTQ